MGGTGGVPSCDSTANGFIKTLTPGDFQVSAIDMEDTTNLPDTWGGFSVSIEITGEQVGHIMQFGFQSNATNFDPSGVFYDNVVLNPGEQYTQDFELLDIDSATIGDGWLFANNVFDPAGNYLFTYSDPAPNATSDPANIYISAIVADQGGADQGDQQLSVFSDYNCCQPDQGHLDGGNVEVNVFQERTVTAEDIGTTFVFSFDAKRGNINEGCPAP